MRKLRNKYYILRHGDNTYMTKRKGWTYPKVDSPRVRLTKKGKKQVRASARRLKKEKIDLIFSSDFFRTRQAAKIAAKALGIDKVFFDRRLRDVNLGIYHGLREEEFYKRFYPPSKERFSKTPPGGESWLACQERVASFLREIDRKHKGKKILMVGHGDPFWLLEGWVKEWPREKMLKEGKTNYIKVGDFKKLYDGA